MTRKQAIDILMKATREAMKKWEEMFPGIIGSERMEYINSFIRATVDKDILDLI